MQNYQTNNLKIAIQKKGRLAEKSREWLGQNGLDFTASSRQLFSRCANFPLDIIYLRDDNIPDFISEGIADFGIVGEDILREKNNDLKIMKKLDFARCSLFIAFPQKKEKVSLQELNGKSIATSYPNCLENFLKKNNLKAKIIKMSGSVEIAPSTGIADCICDLVSTGATLKENGLVPMYKIFDSQAVLVGNNNLNIKRLIEAYATNKNCK